MFWRDSWGTVLVLILVLPVASAAGFWLWIRRQPHIDVESGTKAWDVFIKLIGALTVTVSGAMLFGKYIDERADADRAAAAQASRELALREAEFLRQKLAFDTQHHERKARLLGEAKTVAARIASSARPDPSSLTRFEELYHADLIGVEVPRGEVEAAMVRFRRKLRNDPEAPPDPLQSLSLQLSAAVENELRESEEALLEQHQTIARLLSARDGDQRRR